VSDSSGSGRRFRYLECALFPALPDGRKPVL